MDSVLLYETKLIIFGFSLRQFLLFTQTISYTMGDCLPLGCLVLGSFALAHEGS